MSRNVTQEISTTNNLNPTITGEEDPSTRKILEGGSPQNYICFLCSVYRHRVALVSSARISLVLGRSQLRDRKILVPCKLSLFVRSQYQGQTRKKQLRVIQWVITAIMADHFVWRYHQLIIVINASKESRRAKIVFLWFSPAMLNYFST